MKKYPTGINKLNEEEKKKKQKRRNNVKDYVKSEFIINLFIYKTHILILRVDRLDCVSNQCSCISLDLCQWIFIE